MSRILLHFSALQKTSGLILGGLILRSTAAGSYRRVSNDFVTYGLFPFGREDIQRRIGGGRQIHLKKVGFISREDCHRLDFPEVFFES